MKLRIAVAGLIACCLVGAPAHAQQSVIIRKPDNSAPLALGQQAKAASLPMALPSDQFQTTSTSTGVTITTHLTFQALLTSSSSRKGCLVQNISTDLEYIFVGATGSATVNNSLHLWPGQSLGCNAFGIQPTDNLAITSDTTDGAKAVLVSQ